MLPLQSLERDRCPGESLQNSPFTKHAQRHGQRLLGQLHQLEVYVSSLKVPGCGVKYGWSEGPWPLSLMVVMFPEPLMGEDWQMTESFSSWCMGPRHRCTWHPSCCRQRRGAVCQEGCADHKMFLWALQKGTSYGSETKALLLALSGSLGCMHTRGEKLMGKSPPTANAMLGYRQTQDWSKSLFWDC